MGRLPFPIRWRAGAKIEGHPNANERTSEYETADISVNGSTHHNDDDINQNEKPHDDKYHFEPLPISTAETGSVIDSPR
jgi:hypothetical protein